MSGTLADYGIPDDFVKKLSQTIPEGSSALFILFRSVTEDKVLAEIERSRQRIQAKEAAAREFVAGHLTLREAAARFREADAGIPARQLARWREACPDECGTDDDRYCWTVVRYVECEARHDPEHGPEALQCLASELPESLRALLADCPEFR